MFFFVAIFTQSLAVGNIQAKFWMIRKWFDVVSVKVAATSVTASLASEVIPSKYVKAPALILGRKPNTQAFRALAIFVGMNGRATNGDLADCRADRSAFFWSTWSATFFARKSGGSPHSCASAFRKVTALHERWPTNYGTLHDHSTVLNALRVVPIKSSSVFCELGHKMKFAALVAPFLTLGKSLQKFLKTDPGFFSDHLASAEDCLCHRSIIAAKGQF